MLIICCFSALHLQPRDCIWRKLETLLLLGIVIIKMREGAESAALHCCQDSKATLLRSLPRGLFSLSCDCALRLQREWGHNLAEIVLRAPGKAKLGIFSGRLWVISCFESHVWKDVGAPWNVITLMRLHVCLRCGINGLRSWNMLCSCRLVNEQFPLFGAERHWEGKLALSSTQNAFRGSFWCASAANCKMRFPLFSLYHNHPKDRVLLYASFQPEWNLSVQECHTHEHKGVFSCSMLHCDQGKRASAEKALCSPFFSIPFGKLCLWPLLRALSACAGSSTEGN